MGRETIIAQAIEIKSIQERAVFLEEACRGDPELRREVEKGVRDHFRVGGSPEQTAAHLVAIADELVSEGPKTVTGTRKPMEQIVEGGGQATGPASTPVECPAQPRQLGDYRILREVGRGGMGVVYEAVQESLGRHVALKVLSSHALLSPTQRERFRRESRAAARLHHTNIVPVFGVGEQEGVHFYAMQFIHGQGL